MDRHDVLSQLGANTTPLEGPQQQATPPTQTQAAPPAVAQPSVQPANLPGDADDLVDNRWDDKEGYVVQNRRLSSP